MENIEAEFLQTLSNRVDLQLLTMTPDTHMLTYQLQEIYCSRVPFVALV